MSMLLSNNIKSKLKLLEDAEEDSSLTKNKLKNYLGRKGINIKALKNGPV